MMESTVICDAAKYAAANSTKNMFFNGPDMLQGNVLDFRKDATGCTALSFFRLKYHHLCSPRVQIMNMLSSALYGPQS